MRNAIWDPSADVLFGSRIRHFERWPAAMLFRSRAGRNRRKTGTLASMRLNDIFGIVLIPRNPSRKIVGCVQMRKNRALETRDLAVVQSSHNLHPDFNDGRLGRLKSVPSGDLSGRQFAATSPVMYTSQIWLRKMASFCIFAHMWISAASPRAEAAPIHCFIVTEKRAR